MDKIVGNFYPNNLLVSCLIVILCKARFFFVVPLVNEHRIRYGGSIPNSIMEEYCPFEANFQTEFRQSLLYKSDRFEDEINAKDIVRGRNRNNNYMLNVNTAYFELPMRCIVQVSLSACFVGFFFRKQRSASAVKYESRFPCRFYCINYVNKSIRT